MTRPRRVLLLGMMGAGKSTVGTELARLLGWTYVDNDVLLDGEGGLSTRELEGEVGTDELHRREGEVVRRLAAWPEPVVVGVAASAVDDPDLRALLRAAGRTVWLRASLDTLAARVAAAPPRPRIDPDDVRGSLERINEGRAERFADTAELVIDVDDVAPQALAAAVAAGLGLTVAG